LIRYGPFWICTTLIFVTAALGNFATFLSFKPTPAEPKWHYDINKVSYGSAIFYGYIAVIPLLLFFVMRYFGAAIGLIQLWCLYGYSLAVFIPITVRYASYMLIIPYFFSESLSAAVQACRLVSCICLRICFAAGFFDIIETTCITCPCSSCVLSPWKWLGGVL
jgi:hypothetical protein